MVSAGNAITRVWMILACAIFLSFTAYGAQPADFSLLIIGNSMDSSQSYYTSRGDAAPFDATGIRDQLDIKKKEL